MLCIYSLHHDPFFNLAAEEHLLKSGGEDVFMLWRSDPAVVVGKHQNTLAEINYRFTRMHDIPVARRLTGGGTVYHDPGNINFTFIREGEPGKLVNFGLFIEPVTEYLKKLGIHAYQGEKNEILVTDKKISGNAEHVFRNRVLHHGTLLYDTDLSRLHEAIRPGTGKFSGKAVQSNRSTVMNLKDSMRNTLSTSEFCEGFLDYILRRFNGQQYNPDESTLSAIQRLSDDKYHTWEWVYGWSPDYHYQQEVNTGSLAMSIDMETHRGVITSSFFTSAVVPRNLMDKLTAKLRDTPHEEVNIREQLMASGFSTITTKEEFDELVFAFFG